MCHPVSRVECPIWFVLTLATPALWLATPTFQKLTRFFSFWLTDFHFAPYPITNKLATYLMPDLITKVVDFQLNVSSPSAKTTLHQLLPQKLHPCSPVSALVTERSPPRPADWPPRVWAVYPDRSESAFFRPAETTLTSTESRRLGANAAAVCRRTKSHQPGK